MICCFAGTNRPGLDASLLKFRDAGANAWFPPVDIYETQDSIVLKAEVPGIEISGINIDVDSNVLTLKGERKPSRNLSEENFHRVERFYKTVCQGL